MKKKLTLTEEALKMQKLAGLADIESGESLINEEINEAPAHMPVPVKSFQKGDLVWAPHEGNAGLTGLVVSDHPNKDGEIDVYFRGWGGDILQVHPEEQGLKELKGDLIDLAEKKGDLLHYPSIAKKLGITLNPIYKELADAEEELHSNEDALNIDETIEPEVSSEPEIKEEPRIWYQADYYDKQGGHGALQGSSANFDAELRKAAELYSREKKNSELGKSTGYIGVSGSGDKFAILYLDQAYFNSMDVKYFKDPAAYEVWMRMAKKVLETGKPQKGSYPTEA